MLMRTLAFRDLAQRMIIAAQRVASGNVAAVKTHGPALTRPDIIRVASRMRPQQSRRVCVDS